MKQSLKFLLKGSISLLVIGFFITMVQTSCTKSDAQSAKPAGTTGSTRQPLMLLSVLYNNSRSVPNQIWLMNADGTNYHSITITGLPVNVMYNGGVLTSDGSHLVYTTVDTTSASGSGYAGLYSSKITGDSTVELLANTDPSIYEVNVVDIK